VIGRAHGPQRHAFRIRESLHDLDASVAGVLDRPQRVGAPGEVLVHHEEMGRAVGAQRDDVLLRHAGRGRVPEQTRQGAGGEAKGSQVHGQLRLSAGKFRELTLGQMQPPNHGRVVTRPLIGLNQKRIRVGKWTSGHPHLNIDPPNEGTEQNTACLEDLCN
jgi:hypothetical protein